MLHSPTPWVDLATLIAMFVLPFLPAWLFEGHARSSTGLAGMSVESYHLAPLGPTGLGLLDDPTRRDLQEQHAPTRAGRLPAEQKTGLDDEEAWRAGDRVGD
jgi:hypothetical protein